jgi:hypothetical protein
MCGAGNGGHGGATPGPGSRRRSSCWLHRWCVAAAAGAPGRGRRWGGRSRRTGAARRSDPAAGRLVGDGRRDVVSGPRAAAGDRHPAGRGVPRGVASSRRPCGRACCGSRPVRSSASARRCSSRPPSPAARPVGCRVGAAAAGRGRRAGRAEATAHRHAGGAGAGRAPPASTRRRCCAAAPGSNTAPRATARSAVQEVDPERPD